MNNITPHSSAVSLWERKRITHTAPTVFWMTGLSGAGKSTIAALFERQMTDEGYHAVMLDGDTMRTGLCAGLGFSPEDRRENLRRIAESAKLLAASGTVCVVCAISPDEESRRRAREIISPAASFYEVYVHAPVETCAERDPKGLYRRAYAGEIPQFTGVSAPYEVPKRPDLTLDTTCHTAEECAQRLFDAAVDAIYRPDALLADMIASALEAARQILAIYHSDYSVTVKADESPLTTADTASNEILTGYLSARYPEYEILTEEAADDLDKYGVPRRLNGMGTFIIDPLDGTKEFIKRNGEFCVSIGFASHHRVMAGVICVPEKNWIYYAFEGRGAYKIENADTAFDKDRFSIGMGARLSVSDRCEKVVLTASRSHGDSETEELIAENRARIGEIVSVGSCLKGCMIAEGAADVHYRFGAFMKEWDTAGMEILCREAGAIFTDLDGRPYSANRADPVNRRGMIILNRAESALTMTKTK